MTPLSVKKPFIIEITETLQRPTTVYATSKEEALQIIRKKYLSGEIVLDETDLVDTDFKVID